MEKQRVMLYFGSFNPPHIGHISISEWIIEKNLADRVVLIVSPRNPLKDSTLLTDEFHRFQMAQMAAQSSRYPEKIAASAIEFTLSRPSFTINTLDELERVCKEKMEFSILMGADNAQNIGKWYRYEDILSRYKIYVYPREGYIPKKNPGMIYLDEAPHFEISSTQIRQKLLMGEDTRGILQDIVKEYITANSLWKENR